MRFSVKVVSVLFAAFCAVACQHAVAPTAYDQTLDVQSDPADVESGSTSTILATVKEAMMPKPGVKVSFSASGGCGTLSATSATTQGSVGPATLGQATATFKANSPYSSCSALITATAKTTATTLITVTPHGVSLTAPDSSVPLGENLPSVTVIPNVSMPVSDGFSATYAITSNDANIDQIRIQTTQNANVTSSNGATPPDGAATNPKDTILVEPPGNNYNSESISVTSDSLKLGKLIMTVTLRNPYGGASIPLKFVVPGTTQGSLPGPG